MIPSPDRFAAKMAERGVGNDDKVIVYDASGLSSAGRSWWLLRLFGLPTVALLACGLPKWKARTRRSRPKRQPSRGSAALRHVLDPALVRGKGRYSSAMSNSRRELVVDARSVRPVRRRAPRKPGSGRRRGHIPGSRNLLFDQVTDPKTRQKLRRAPTSWRRLFAGAGVALRQAGGHELRLRCDGVRFWPSPLYLIGHDRGGDL